MKTLRIISRILVGVIFIFSGFVKGIDPLGSMYKFIDYYVAFGIGSLEFTALPLSFILSAIEFLIGIVLLWGIRMRFFSWVAMIFMVGFTLLTLNLAIYNPVSDCGCFGDAIILTNWQTFWKNVIILAFVVVIFIGRKQYPRLYKQPTEWGIVTVFFILFLLFSWYNYQHLPMMDYRPYHIGAHIPEKMEIPEDAPTDEYETIFFYKNKNTGNVKKFTSDNYPWKDSTNWEFVKYESKLVQKGYEPPIDQFKITTPNGKNILDSVLADPNYSFILVSHTLTETTPNSLIKADSIYNYCQTAPKFSFYGLTSTPESEVNHLKQQYNLNMPFYTADKVTLETIVRANPGLLLLKNGTIIGKWHYNDFPSVKEINQHYIADLINSYRQKYENRFAVLFGLGILFLILTFMIVRKQICKNQTL